MEYIIFAAVLAVLFVFYVIRCGMDDKKRKAAFEKSLYTDYGMPSGKKYPEGRLSTIAGHFKKQKKEMGLDEITWNDLELEKVFQKVDYTFSAAGEEALYTLLRCPSMDKEELTRREKLISYFMEHEKERVSYQLLFARIGRTGKYSIYDYIDYLDTLGKRSNSRHIVMLVLLACSVIGCLYDVVLGGTAIGILFTINLLTYFQEKGEIDPYITTFSYFLRILKMETQFSDFGSEQLKPLIGAMDESRKKFKKFGRFSSLCMNQNSMSGNPLDIVMDYVFMLTHINIIKFNTMLSEVQKYKKDIIFIIETMGYIESMISIGAYRASLEGYCVPEFYEKSAVKSSSKSEVKCSSAAGNRKLHGENLYHPLIEEPVKNSVSLQKGMILTGSNASGKSTFLKTVALAQIMAQTIHTVCADVYVTGFYEVYTSMALRDSLEQKDSYFIVEIKSLKRIIDRAGQGEAGVMCFVDEVLRGTNTVERIAASSEILDNLRKSGVFCFAATHDIELVSILKDSYETYHFEETIEDNDVRFNYILRDGKATSRNAIRLLGVLGYEEEITERAEERARRFLQSGLWK